jgi:hypothetical protein
MISGVERFVKRQKGDLFRDALEDLRTGRIVPVFVGFAIEQSAPTAILISTLVAAQRPAQ